MHSSADLITIPDWQLKRYAPDATHQHFKGGLYRVIGILYDSETGEQARNANGDVLMVYEHLYPHERRFWSRSFTDFYGFHESGKLRFRELE